MSFSESQRINLGLRMVVLVGMLPTVFIMAREYKQQPTTENLLVLFLIIFLPVALYFLFLNNKANTRIDSLGIHYQYWPFIARWRTLNWSDIKSVTIKNIAPLTDFGGWGYKFGQKKKGIILSGDKAIYIQLSNDRIFAITTSEPEKARSAIAQWAEEKLV